MRSAVRIPVSCECPSVLVIRVVDRRPSPPRPVRSAATDCFMMATDRNAAEESWSQKRRHAVETPTKEQHTLQFQVKPSFTHISVLRGVRNRNVVSVYFFYGEFSAQSTLR